MSCKESQEGSVYVQQDVDIQQRRRGEGIASREAVEDC